jgi:hypothetical protein
MDIIVDDVNDLLLETNCEYIDDETIDAIQESIIQLQNEITIKPIRCLCGEDYTVETLVEHFDSSDHDYRTTIIECSKEDYENGEYNKSIIPFKQIQEEALSKMNKCKIKDRNHNVKAIYICECGLFMDYKAYNYHLKDKLHTKRMNDKVVPIVEEEEQFIEVDEDDERLKPTENIIMSISEPIACC